MTDINELIKSEPYKSCYEYGELVGIKQGREDAIVEAIEVAGLKEWLEEHDKQIRADAIDEIEDAIINSFDDVDNDNTVTVISVLHHIHEVLGSLKEKKDE